jgi:hypothetical protein
VCWSSARCAAGAGCAAMDTWWCWRRESRAEIVAGGDVIVWGRLRAWFMPGLRGIPARLCVPWT